MREERTINLGGRGNAENEKGMIKGSIQIGGVRLVISHATTIAAFCGLLRLGVQVGVQLGFLSSHFASFVHRVLLRGFFG